MPNGKTQILHSLTSTCISSYPGPTRSVHKTRTPQDTSPSPLTDTPKTDTRLLMVSYIPTLPLNFNIFNTFHPQNFRQNHRNAIQSTASTFPHPPLALIFISLRKQSSEKIRENQGWGCYGKTKNLKCVFAELFLFEYILNLHTKD